MHRASHYRAFLPNAVTFKSVENYLRKICSALAPKKFVKLRPE